MKLVELECQNCGAALKIEEGADTITCPYCNATYKIDDEVKHVKYDDMENSGYEFEKGRIKAQKEHIANNTVLGQTKFPVFIIPIFFIMIIGMSIIMITRMHSARKEFSNSVDNSVTQKAKEEAEANEKQQKLESERYSFIYDTVCDYIDKKYLECNYCDFKDDICVFFRNHPKIMHKDGCCYSDARGGLCENLKNHRCQIKSISCKLYSCEYLRNKKVKKRN